MGCFSSRVEAPTEEPGPPAAEKGSLARTNGRRDSAPEVDSPSAGSDWSQAIRKALLEMPETEVQPPPFAQSLACEADFASVIHGSTAHIPDGLTRSMEEEFRSNDEGEWWSEYEYVVYGVAVEKEMRVTEFAPVHVRDAGHGGMRLKDFTVLASVSKAGLTQAEVAAVRLYTSPWFRLANTALRRRDDSTIQRWATSISLVTSAVIKLSMLSPTDNVLYRSLPSTFDAARCLEGRATETIVDLAFVSCSTDPAFVAAYNGSKRAEGQILVVQTTFGSRAADISGVSQYPQQSEWTFPPYTEMQVLGAERMAELPKGLILVRPAICTMRHHTDGLRYPWSSPDDPLTYDEYKLTLAAEHTAGGDGKFASDVRELLSGEPKTAALGLEDYMRAEMHEVLGAHASKVDAIVAEFEASKDDALLWWLHYVLHEPASCETMPWGEREGGVDEGRTGLRLRDFLERPQASKAKLRLEHVLALRLYTCTPVSFALNGPLRAFKRDESGELVRPIEMSSSHPFPVTIFLLHEAIKRLRDAEGDAVVTLWRGVKNMEVPKMFLRSGGVEMAPMSTTYSLSTALFYSQSPHSVIFKIVTRSFMERGADVAWLSAFPNERECLFPPLTFLSPTGRVQCVGDTFTIVEVTPRL